jgi:hypothetical protein
MNMNMTQLRSRYDEQHEQSRRSTPLHWERGVEDCGLRLSGQADNSAVARYRSLKRTENRDT